MLFGESPVLEVKFVILLASTRKSTIIWTGYMTQYTLMIFPNNKITKNLYTVAVYNILCIYLK